ncbi:hypothetical protein NA57DRAFT_75257 [Rhizodiscina lignyota]|uniref:Uncharacterized protein n=1 Tax=Rhizodiscina lignyota TaxID=1504668 RepID=A0A9P4IJP7_9PEZI|nr:hypothetical protein NA57DRAFT_75257 [Rhizodiscina lignyota]
MPYFEGESSGESLEIIQYTIRRLEKYPPERWEAVTEKRFQRDPPLRIIYDSGISVSPLSLPSPSWDELNKSDIYEWKWKRLNASMPASQFISQVDMEILRIHHQDTLWQDGRQHTLPLDQSLDWFLNAQNNVRNRWIQQGIWKSGWGRAWSARTETDPETGQKWGYLDGGMSVHGHWAHEADDVEHPMLDRYEKLQARSISEGYPWLTDVSASRPDRQFMFQASIEMDWIQNKREFWSMPRNTEDLVIAAFTAVKQSWVEREIWNPKWVNFPGRTWMHEDHEERPPTPATIRVDCLERQKLQQIQEQLETNRIITAGQPRNESHDTNCVRPITPGTSHGDTEVRRGEAQPILPLSSPRHSPQPSSSTVPAAEFHWGQRFLKYVELQAEDDSSFDIKRQGRVGDQELHNLIKGRIFGPAPTITFLIHDAILEHWRDFLLSSAQTEGDTERFRNSVVVYEDPRTCDRDEQRRDPIDEASRSPTRRSARIAGQVQTAGHQQNVLKKQPVQKPKIQVIEDPFMVVGEQLIASIRYPVESPEHKVTQADDPPTPPPTQAAKRKMTDEEEVENTEWQAKKPHVRRSTRNSSKAPAEESCANVPKQTSSKGARHTR